MTKSSCSIPGCNRSVHARELCAAHYKKYRLYGDPLRGRIKYSSPDESFLARAHRDSLTGCLVWQGATGSNGYGQITVAGKSVYAHRFAWERVNGPVPDGMLIDHRCFRRDCVEVSHMRLASAFQNQQNRAGAMPSNRSGARNVYKRANGTYTVRVKHRGVNHYGGCFSSLDSAIEAAKALRTRLFGAFAGRG